MVIERSRRFDKLSDRRKCYNRSMVSMAAFDIGTFIETDPAWHDGWPYVRGTRKTVASVGELYETGCSAERIADEKDMTLPQVHAALCYYLANRDQIMETVREYGAAVEARASAWPTKRRS